MEQDKSLVSLFEASVRKNWFKNAVSDYHGDTLRYSDLALRIEFIHVVFEAAGLKKGDRVAICSRNCSNWAVAFWATLTYGAVAVPILHEFKSEQVKNIVNHSEAKVFFVGDIVWKGLKEEEVPDVVGIVNLMDFSLYTSRRPELDYAFEHMNELFAKKYPKHFRSDCISYYKQDGDALAIINYTSGSTGKSKGVMIPYRALWSNVQFVIDEIGDIIAPEGTVVSILPMAHMYGLAFEMISELCLGMHVYYLTKVPSPSIIFKAFAEIKPTFIVSVPLIIEKVMRKMVMSKMEDFKIKMLLKLPVISQKIKDSINEKLKEAFGGRYYEIIVGGAAFNSDVENLMYSIGFNYTVGYGTTETAPLITYADWKEFKPGSCGKAVARMEVKINSNDPEREVGEILCRGDNVMLGYYKNEEETAKTLDKDGWYHTGDLGIIDKDGFLYIRGRSKNMLLGPSGQNIYPEEIEDKLNAMPLVAESVVIQKGVKLYGLIYPDADEAQKQGIATGDIPQLLEQTRKEVNAELPAYEQITAIKIMDREFEKTPKKSIKRFLYFDEEVS